MTESPPTSSRIESIDRLRGLVMVVMVIDHVRDFLGLVQAPETMADPGLPLFLTRFVTHFCAPVFVLLAGVGAWFYGARNRTRAELQRFLWTRGLWLIVLDLTVIFVGWMLLVPFAPFMIFQVIWTLGWSMILLALLLYLPRRWIFWIALAVTLGHDALSRLPIDIDAVAAGENLITDPTTQAYSVLHVGFKFLQIGGQGPILLHIYPIVPWFAVMALGYSIGPWLANQETRRRNCALAGILATLAFVGLRFLWPGLDRNSPYESAGLIDFLNTTKYPPSLPFLLMTLGPACLVLAGLEKGRVANREGGLLLVFGRVPLFFYIAHIYLSHALAIAWVKVSRGVWFLRITEPAPPDPAALWEIYAVSALVVLILYPVCKWFMALKSRRRDLWWLSYL